MRIIKISDQFWNIRGSFKIGGLLDIGTQASLVRCGDGRFVFLDSLTLDDATRKEVDAITDDGSAVAAVFNLHPFHTVHVTEMHQAFPDAVHYGTQRHLERFADLNWAAERTEDAALHALFADDFSFSVPRGVDFISDNPNLHFSSVLAYHRASKTMHVDDTLMYMKLPKPLGTSVSFHLTLAKCLEQRAGATDDFRAWANELIADWGDAQHLCAAHSHAFLNCADGLGPHMQQALDKVEKKLVKHQRKFG